MRSWMTLAEGRSFPDALRGPAASLRKNGYRLVPNGAGQFSAVFRKTGQGTLVKLFLAEDRAYSSFVALAKANPNPHFPVFTGNIVQATPIFSAIRVEPLTANKTVAMTKFCHLTGLYMETVNEEPDPKFQNSPFGVQAARTMVTQHSPHLKQACDLIATKLLDRFNLDLETRNNVMMRGETFVFSDPVALALE